MRSFDIGDEIINIQTGVVGKCIKFYVPTACEEQTMVVTEDGRKYHAPTSTWKLRTVDAVDEMLKLIHKLHI